MAQKPTFQLRLSQKLVMTPSLQYAIKLLPMSRQELVETVNLELSENPVLEDIQDAGEAEETTGGEPEGDAGESAAAGVGDETSESDGQDAESGGSEAAGNAEAPSPEAPAESMDERKDFDDVDISNFFNDYQDENWRPSYQVDTTELPSFENTLSTPPTLSDHLLWQLDCTPCTPRAHEICEAIIGNLEEDGYLRVPLEEVAAMGDYQMIEVEEALGIVQSLDPAGIAARTLQECLLNQIRSLGHQGTATERLVAEHADLLLSNDVQRLCERLCCTEDDLQHHMDIVRHLDPHPGLKYSHAKPFYVVPDVIVVKIEGEYVVALNEEGMPRLRISPTYARILSTRALDGDAEGKKFVRERFKSALWLIKSLDQRQRTVYRVSDALVKRQREFLDRGRTWLKPLVLRDVAEELGVHESTVGRVVANKFMQTPQGIIPMKAFFNRGLECDRGESVSTTSVKDRIREIISREESRSPLSDAAIAAMLRNERLRIARRTVAKYREELKIPASHLRRGNGHSGHAHASHAASPAVVVEAAVEVSAPVETIVRSES